MRRLLLLLLLFAGNLIYAQVGIGTDLPNPSTQLEIVSSSRGVLIPQVPLTSLTDRTTITAGNVASLLVYNTSTNETMTPGYYYWFQDRWRRIVNDTDIPGFTDTLVDNGDGTFTHTAVDGTVVVFDANTTTYVNNGDGTYTFTNANGATMTIDIIGDVINNIVNEGDIYNEIINIILSNTDALVDNEDGTFTHTAVDGTVVVFDANTTTYVNNGDGTYTFSNANGATMTIDIIGDVVNNIVNEGDIYNEIINIILGNSDELVDNGDGTFTHTAVDGTVVVFDANTTTFINNGNGTYTFTNANGDTMIVDVIGDVVTNIQNQGDIYNEIINIILGNSDELVNNGDGTFTHTAVDGTVVVFDANTTTFINNGNGTYTFTNANGDTMTIDVVNDVVTNIQNEGEIYDEILAIILANTDALVDNGDGTFTHTAVDGTVLVFDANTTSFVNNGDGTYTFTNANGDTMTIDVINDVVTNIQNQGDIYNEIISIILGNSDELVDNGDGTFTHTAVDGTVVVFDANTTSFVNNGDGTYTFTNANGDTMTIDVVNDVVTNIQNEGEIYDEILAIILANTDALVDNGDGTFTHTAVDGTVLVFDANTTSFVNNGDGTYTFTNANGDTMTIDVVNDVVTNIQNEGEIYDEILAIILANTDALVDNGDGTFTHTAVDGTVLVFDANTTTYVNNGDGTYTFTNANGDTMTIDVIGDVVTNIQNQGDIYDEILNLINLHETLTVLTYNEAENQLTYQDEEGNTHTIQLNNTDLTYDAVNQKLVYTNSKGETQEIDLAALVTGNETITTLTDHGDGTFTYKNEAGVEVTFDATRTNITNNGDGTYTVIDPDGNPVIIDIPGDIINNFNDIALGGPVTVGGVTYNTVEEYIQHLVNTTETLTELTYDAEENQLSYKDENGDTHVIQLNNTDLTYDAVGQKLVYTNSKGETQEIDLGDLVSGNETITTLTDHGDGTFTYKNEAGVEVTFDATRTNITNNGDGTYTVIDPDGNPVVIDIPGDIINNFNDIALGGPVTVGGVTYNTVEEYIQHLVNTTETLTELTYDAEENQLSYKDENGDTHVIQLNNTDLTYDAVGQKLVYTNSKGETQEIDLGDLVSGNETITTLTDHGDGTFTYKNEAGVEVTFDATRTNITNNGDGTYTVIDPDGNPVVIDIPGDIINNFNDIALGGPVTVGGVTYNTVEEYIQHLVNTTETLTELTYDAEENQLSYKDENGDTHVIQLNNTDLTYDAVGQKLVYTNSKGETQEIDLGDLVSGNETITTLTDHGDGTFTYKNEAGVEVTFDATRTNITNNGDGTYTVIDPDGNPVIIDIPGDIINNFNNIALGGPVTVGGVTYNTVEEYIQHLVNTTETLTELTYDAEENQLSYKDENGDTHVIQLNNTDLTYDAVGQKLVYTNSKGETQEIDLGDLVSGNETITTLTDHGDGTFTYKNEAGVEVTFDATRTNITNNGDGTYTVIDPDGNPVIIDIPGDIINNFNDIALGGPVTVGGVTYNTVEEYIQHLVNTTETLTELTYDAEENQLSYKDENGDTHVIQLNNTDLTYDAVGQKLVYTNSKGETQEIDLGDLVSGNETITTLADNGNGTYTYTSEDGTVTIIDIPASVVENFETIVKDGPVTVDSNTFNTIEEYIEYLASSSVTIEGGDHITVTGSGTAADPYVVTIDGGADNSMLITDDNGDVVWATIEDIVQENQKTTTVVGEGLIEVTGTTTGNNTEYVVKSNTPKFFYMPAVIFNTTQNGTATRDLYQDYKDQFTGANHFIDHGVGGGTVQYTGGLVASAGAPAQMEVYESDELFYYISYYDQEVFENLSITADGKLTYTIKSDATDSSYMNIIFVVKEQ